MQLQEQAYAISIIKTQSISLYLFRSIADSNLFRFRYANQGLREQYWMLFSLAID